MFGRGSRSFVPATALAGRAARLCKGVKKLIYRPSLCVSREESSAILRSSGTHDVSLGLPLWWRFRVVICVVTGSWIQHLKCEGSSPSASACPPEPGTGVLQRRQPILPDGAGQTGGPWRVSPHRHVHHAGEAPGTLRSGGGEGAAPRQDEARWRDRCSFKPSDKVQTHKVLRK